MRKVSLISFPVRENSELRREDDLGQDNGAAVCWLEDYPPLLKIET